MIEKIVSIWLIEKSFMKINNKFETNLEKLLKEFYIKRKKLIYFLNHFTGREF